MFFVEETDYCIIELTSQRRGGRGHSFIRGGSAVPKSKPFHFYIPILKEKVTLSYTSHRKYYSCYIFTVEILHPLSKLLLLYCFNDLAARCTRFFNGLLNAKMTVFHTLWIRPPGAHPYLVYAFSLKKVPLSGGASRHSSLQGVPPPRVKLD